MQVLISSLVALALLCCACGSAQKPATTSGVPVREPLDVGPSMAVRPFAPDNESLPVADSDSISRIERVFELASNDSGDWVATRLSSVNRVRDSGEPHDMDVLFTIQGTDRPPDARFKFSRKLVIPVGGGVFVSLLLHFDDYMLAVPGHELTQIEAGDEEDELWTGDLHIEISMKFFDAVGTDRWELGVRVRTRFRPDRTVWQTTKSSLWLIFDDGSEIELPVYDAE